MPDNLSWEAVPLERERIHQTLAPQGPARPQWRQVSVRLTAPLGIEPVCEGIETVGEHDALADLGVGLMQGYLLAKPGVERLPEVAWVQPTSLSARSA
ncbi:MAG: EAL domain-containing protein [Pseudomonas sp.]|nr:MAG: EAL domain-containing protein [Pseudomonas sp.]